MKSNTSEKYKQNITEIIKENQRPLQKFEIDRALKTKMRNHSYLTMESVIIEMRKNKKLTLSRISNRYFYGVKDDD